MYSQDGRRTLDCENKKALLVVVLKRGFFVNAVANCLSHEDSAIIYVILSSSVAHRFGELPEYWNTSLCGNELRHRRNILFVCWGNDGIYNIFFQVIVSKKFLFNYRLFCFSPNDLLNWQIILWRSFVVFCREDSWECMIVLVLYASSVYNAEFVLH